MSATLYLSAIGGKKLKSYATRKRTILRLTIFHLALKEVEQKPEEIGFSSLMIQHESEEKSDKLTTLS